MVSGKIFRNTSISKALNYDIQWFNTDKHGEHYCWRWNFKFRRWRSGSKNHTPLINCAKNRFKKLFVSTGDADLLILLMSVLPPTNCLRVFEYFVGLALKGLRYYKVNGLCLSMANDVCIALPFFSCFYGVWHNVKFLQSQSPSIETHVAVVRGLPTKTFLSECVNEKSSTERRS